MSLLIMELFLGSMVLLWFGLGALLVACMILLAPGLGLTFQLLAWALGSGLLTFLWFRHLKPRSALRTRAGTALEGIVGQTGLVVKAADPGGRSTVRFSMPLMGSVEWPVISRSDLKEGDRVVVRDVSGNTLVVDKAH
jgi:membrane protein implicated in regulation of membrane protease activity